MSIQRSTALGPLSAAEARERLRHAPKWFLERVDRAREKRGLAPLRERPRKAAVAPRHPRAVKRTAPAPALQVAIALFPGTGVIPGGREIFERGAFDFWWLAFKKGAFRDFVVRSGGHDGAIVGSVKDGTVSLRPIEGVGIVAVWTVDMTNLRHAAAVALVRSGMDRASGEFHAIRATLSGGVRRVSMAIPVGVALLHRQEPMYAGAQAVILDPAKSVGVQIGELARKALARAQRK
jgi:hypothetical protein